jgi:hypothetical protein
MGTFGKTGAMIVMLVQLCSCNRGPKALHLKEFIDFDSSLISQKVLSIRALPYHVDHELMTLDSRVFTYCTFLDTNSKNLINVIPDVAPGDSVYKRPFSDTIFFITKKRGAIHYIIWDKKKVFNIPRHSSNWR